MDMDRDAVGPRDQEAISKKVYVAPKLTEYGSVAKLTESTNTSTLSDSGTNHMHV
jgi:hypothetical protein